MNLPKDLNFLEDQLSFIEIQEDKIGIYFLLQNNEIVYIGQSVNAAIRIKSHMSDKEFDNAIFLPAKPEILTLLEEAFICYFRPKYNRQYPKEKPNRNLSELKTFIKKHNGFKKRKKIEQSDYVELVNKYNILVDQYNAMKRKIWYLSQRRETISRNIEAEKINRENKLSEELKYLFDDTQKVEKALIEKQKQLTNLNRVLTRKSKEMEEFKLYRKIKRRRLRYDGGAEHQFLSLVDPDFRPVDLLDFGGGISRYRYETKLIKHEGTKNEYTIAYEVKKIKI